MSEPRRMIDEGRDDFERRILRSARHDAPSRDARKKTLIALGLAGSVGATVTATTATSTASTLLKSTATVALLKWIGAGVLSGIVTLGAIAIAQPGARAPAIVAAKGIAPRAEQRKASVAPAPAPEPRAEAPAPAPHADEPAPAASASAASSTSPRPAPTSLTEEIAALDVAREALGSGDAARALRAVDEHDRKFPGGMLGPEAMVLRIEALVARGDRATAARLGNAFLEAHPNSPHASRIRSLVGAP